MANRLLDEMGASPAKDTGADNTDAGNSLLDEMNSSGADFSAPTATAQDDNFRKYLEMGNDQSAKFDAIAQQKLAEQKAKDNAPKSVGGFFENVIDSGKRFVGDIANVVKHPIDTATAVGSMAVGAVEKLIPGRQQQEQSFDNLVDFFKNRYGSVDKITNTLYQDPVGVLSDFAGLLSAGGGLIAKAGEVGKIGELSKVGRMASLAGEAIDPLGQALRVSGDIVGGAVKAQNLRFSPFASSYNKEVADIAKANDITLPISSVTKSPVARTVEAIGSKGLFGNKLSKMVEEAGTQIHNVVDNYINSFGATNDLTEVGKAVVKGANEFKQDWIKTKNALYDKINLNGIRVELPETLNFVKQVFEDKKSAMKVLGQSTDYNFFETLKKSLSKKNLTANDIKVSLRELNAKINNFNDPVVTGNKATLKKIGAMMSEELDNGIKTARPEAQAMIDTANDFYKTGLARMDSFLGKKILKNADRPEKVAKVIVENMTPTDIPKITELIGEKAMEKVRSAYVSEIFKKVHTAGESISPARLESIIVKNEATLRGMMSPAQFEKIKEIQKLAEAYKAGLKVAEGSQTAYIFKLASEASLIFTNPLWGVKAILGDVALNKFLNSRTGREILTTGHAITGDIIRKGAKTLRNNSQKIFQSGRALRIQTDAKQNQ